MPTPDATKAAIVKAAREGGVDPKYALAIAERESAFDPNARASKTISGVFQMRGDNRRAYGGAKADSADPYDQAKAWVPFIKDVKGEMARVLGRDPTDAEAYLGHHFGGVRAARMMKMDPSTPVDTVFTPAELAGNPHIGKAATVGTLNKSVTEDIDQRAKRYDTSQPPSSFGEPVKTLEAGPASGNILQTAPSSPAASVPPELLAQLGQAPPQPSVGRDAPPAAAPILQPDPTAAPSTIPMSLLNSLGA